MTSFETIHARTNDLHYTGPNYYGRPIIMKKLLSVIGGAAFLIGFALILLLPLFDLPELPAILSASFGAAVEIVCGVPVKRAYSAT